MRAIGRAVWRDAVQRRLDDVSVECLSPADFLLHAAAHAMKHLRIIDVPSFSLKDYADMMAVLRKHGDAIGWRAYWQRAEEWDVPVPRVRRSPTD
jgi:hypothetical protein